MRLWSLHPKYLDAKGLVALWREGLLAQKVLQGLTKGYRHHPQLVRFRAAKDPLIAIASYLHAVQEEASTRGYDFDRSKIPDFKKRPAPIPVTDGQLHYELSHLKKKLEMRDPERLKKLKKIKQPDTHPLMTTCSGEIEVWEIPIGRGH